MAECSKLALKIDCGFDGANTAHLQLIHYGPEVSIDIGFDEKWRAASGTRPRADVSMRKALVDTGARETCIDSALARQLNLPHVDRRVVHSVAGAVEVDYFRAQIYVPSLRLALSGPFARPAARRERL